MFLHIFRPVMFALAACLFMPIASSYSLEFHGADVTDNDVPSSYMRVGLYGVRPVVNSVGHGSTESVFQRGDIILAVNGQTVRKSADLNRFIADELAITIFRGSEKKIVTVVRPGSEKVPTSRGGAEKQLLSGGSAAQGLPAGENSMKPVGAAVEAAAKPSGEHAPLVLPEKGLPGSRIVGQPAAESAIQPVAVSAGAAGDVKNIEKKCEAGSDACGAATAAGAPSTVPVKTGDFYNRSFKAAQDRIVFENKRGRVTFSHSVHLQSLNKVQCLLCHQTENPTHEAIQSRLDNHRAAHGFCRGCHQKMGRGPETECHRCHAS